MAVNATTFGRAQAQKHKKVVGGATTILTDSNAKTGSKLFLKRSNPKENATYDGCPLTRIHSKY